MNAPKISVFLLAALLTVLGNVSARADGHHPYGKRGRYGGPIESDGYMGRGGHTPNGPAYRHIEKRNTRQARRIFRGIHSGQITRFEADKLRRQKLRISRVQSRAVADGHLSRHEQKKLHKLQNHAGMHIYRMKHNHKVRRLDRRHRQFGPWKGNACVKRHHHHNGCRRDPCRPRKAWPGHFNHLSLSAWDSGWSLAFSVRSR